MKSHTMIQCDPMDNILKFPQNNSSTVLKDAMDSQYDDLIVIGRHGNDLIISCTDQYLSRKELLWAAKQLELIALHD